MVLFSTERLSAQAFPNSKFDLKNYLERLNTPHQCKSLKAPSSLRAEGLTHVVAKMPHPAQFSHLVWPQQPTCHQQCHQCFNWENTLIVCNTAGGKETSTTPRDVSMAIKHPGRSIQPLTDLWARVCCYLLVPCSDHSTHKHQAAPKC